MALGRGAQRRVVGRVGPKRPRLARHVERFWLPVFRALIRSWGFVELDSRAGRSRLVALRQAIEEGREVYVLGFGVGFHNAGAALVRVSPQGTVELVCNEEEERYTAIKHCTAYPERSVATIAARLSQLGIPTTDVLACVSNWEYAKAMVTFGVRPMLEEAPASMTGRLTRGLDDVASPEAGSLLRRSCRRLAEQLGVPGHMPVVQVRHHDSHACFSYAVSPFAGEQESVIVIVLDGSGDDASTSLYEAREGKLTLLDAHGSNPFDSLGTLYGMLSSTQGGWPMLSSEGRYMGASAWGEGDRLANRYYRSLRHLVHLGPDGEVCLNRALINWTRAGMARPYGKELVEILGEPISAEKMWHPDAVLNVEDVRHPEVTRERVDKAAAVQMVFEDALVHTVEGLIRRTGSHRLVLTGGTALNCVANMRLLECFDERWYERQLGRSQTRLHLWVPPTPGDAGTPMGAAYAFAMRAGARRGAPLKHAFYCGLAATDDEIGAAIKADEQLGSMPLGDCSDPEHMARVADFLAYAIAGDCILGLYQGASETGPRALGHRSILANPCNPHTRALLNERVKHRELIRPLAPMLTRSAAKQLFELHPGAADDDYNAYNYMVLTARAKPLAHSLIPAVIHRDGTGRLQIVRPEVDPFCHEYLLAMGRRVGVEASVNTSLNVGAPIAHTPEQALATLRRARGMDGLLMIGAERLATLVWLDDRADLRERLLDRLREWSTQTGFEALHAGRA